MDGCELAEHLRAQLGREIVLIAISGYGRASDRARSRAAGFHEHFTKPVDLEKLAKVVEQSAPDG